MGTIDIVEFSETTPRFESALELKASSSSLHVKLT